MGTFYNKTHDFIIIFYYSQKYIELKYVSFCVNTEITKLHHVLDNKLTQPV